MAWMPDARSDPPPAMTYTYCVWYRVEDDGPDTESVLRRMMARLACRSGIPGQLVKKCDEPRLWMELYQGVTDAHTFETLLAQAADEYDVDMFIADQRRVECFQAVAAELPACGRRP
jgi:hypothetical protein